MIHNTQTKNKQRGSFVVVLILLIVVVAAIALFVKLVDPVDRYNMSLDAQRKADLQTVSQALNTYYSTYKHYPGNPGLDPFSGAQNCGREGKDYRIIDVTATPVEWGGVWKFYLPNVPKDPEFPKKTYVYYVSCDGASYWLYAHLNRGNKDKDACNGGSACTSFKLPGFPSPQSCGKDNSEVCNYGVSSQNVSL